MTKLWKALTMSHKKHLQQASTSQNQTKHWQQAKNTTERKKHTSTQPKKQTTTKNKKTKIESVSLPGEAWVRFFAETDVDGSGRISFDELEVAIRRLWAEMSGVLGNFLFFFPRVGRWFYRKPKKASKHQTTKTPYDFCFFVSIIFLGVFDGFSRLFESFLGLRLGFLGFFCTVFYVSGLFIFVEFLQLAFFMVFKRDFFSRVF